MNTRTIVRRAHRTTWLAVTGGWVIVAVACGNESVNVLAPRDVSVEADSNDAAGDVSVEASVDVDSDVAMDVTIDVSVDAGSTDASIDPGSIDTPADRPPDDGAPPTGCNGRGVQCALPGECCELSCPLLDGEPRTCAEGPICSGAGQDCRSNADCCAGSCVGPACRGVSVSMGVCLPAGEPCPSDGACCSGVCDPDIGYRCKRLNECRVVGETCPTPDKCCSGRCEPDDRGVRVCTQAPTCTLGSKMCHSQAWDRCMVDSDCCTGVCNLGSEPVHRCTAAPTCQVECGYCTQDLDCCMGNLCRDDGSGYMRCVTSRDL